MKWIIKNPAPSDWRKEKWGDFHFGRSLTKYLKRLGEAVQTDYSSEWQNEKTADVVLVLRGRRNYEPKKNNFNIIWNISHPQSVSLEEYDKYDIVFVASDSYAKILQEKIKKPVYPLLQCTDTEVFYPRDLQNESSKKDIIFVGNTRAVKRPCIIWAVECGIPLKIWGRGWEKWVDKKYIAGEYIENKKLGRLYSTARATLNDHWQDMKQYGYINNRVFDALACALPVISDYHEELFRMFPEEILYYQNKTEFIECVNKMQLYYHQLKLKIKSVFPRIKEEFSSISRAVFLVNTVNKHLSN